MKKKHLWATTLALLSTTFLWQSCLDNGEDNTRVLFPNALVTVKPNIDNSAFYMQLNDEETLLATNIKTSPFGKKEVRALVNYTLERRKDPHYSHLVWVNWIDSIRTKDMAPFLGTQTAARYGNTPVEIVKDWVSLAEDGYLTLRFRTRWGNTARHSVNLVHTEDVNTPYCVTFYHNDNGDAKGTVGDGLVAFRLQNLPDTKGKTVLLTLRWLSYSGEKSTVFKYCSRKTVASFPAAPTRAMLKPLD